TQTVTCTRRWACCGSGATLACCRRERMHESLVREPDAANPHVRFDERGVETEEWGATRAPATERAGQHARPHLHPPRHSSTPPPDSCGCQPACGKCLSRGKRQPAG